MAYGDKRRCAFSGCWDPVNKKERFCDLHKKEKVPDPRSGEMKHKLHKGGFDYSFGLEDFDSEIDFFDIDLEDIPDLETLGEDIF